MIEDILKQNYSEIHKASEEELLAIQQAIDSQELTDLALTLSNIPSRSGHELEAANFVYQWCLEQGFSARKIALDPARPNIVAEYGGDGAGANLLFNAHLDTESPLYDNLLDNDKFTAETLAQPEWQRCWYEDGHFHGYALTNDRGPMSCFLMAAKALKKAGIKLAGKVYLTASPGEVGPEPVESCSGIEFLGKELGTHFLFNHGGVCPDYAVVAEGTDFGVTWQASGYALFRITLYGEGVFTPALYHEGESSTHPNPLHRIGILTEALHEWCQAYERDFRVETPGGVSVGKAQIDSIRGGVPHTFGAGTEVCHIYLDVVLPPGVKASVIERSLKAFLLERSPGRFSLYPSVVRHGFCADEQVYPLVHALGASVQQVQGQLLKLAHSIYSSMWRDHNVFNMNDIPAVTFGFPRQSPTPEDLRQCTLIYALSMLAICGRA
ncbi:hypothetical protein ACPI6F_004515 [Citrobacter freundii]